MEAHQRTAIPPLAMGRFFYLEKTPSACRRRIVSDHPRMDGLTPLPILGAIALSWQTDAGHHYYCPVEATKP